MPSTEFDPKYKRLEARVSSEQNHDEVMALDEQDRKIFVSALLNPELPSGRLRKAVSHYKKGVD
ncbi:MAG: DUF1778 domain-containing protein [Nitrospirae bacterium]|nr:DUF1778 domain-containing protein [Nitrospirota bacterium]